MAFFRQPTVVGERAEQRLAQRVVDLDIGLRDDLVAKAAGRPAALLPAVARARFLVALQNLAAAPGGFLGGLEFGVEVGNGGVD